MAPSVNSLALSYGDSTGSITRVLETNEAVTGPPGAEMLLSTALLNGQPASIVDNASGCGIVPSLLLQLAEKGLISKELKIVAADNDQKYLEQLRKRKAANGDGWSRVEIQEADLQKQPFLTDTFDFAFANFGIFFAPDDVAGLKETFRVLKPGGQAGLTSWKSLSWWQMIQAALNEAYPGAPALPDAIKLVSKGYDRASLIEERCAAAGFTDVRIHEYEVSIDQDAERFGEATGMLVAGVAGRLWSKEDVEKYGTPPKIIEAITRYLNANYEGGRWGGKIVANIAIASKPS